MMPILKQARDNSKHLSNLDINAEKTLEQNSRQIASAVSESISNNSQNSQNTQNNSYTANDSTNRLLYTKSNSKPITE